MGQYISEGDCAAIMRQLMADDKKKIAELEQQVVAGQNWHTLYNECAREREELRKRFLTVCQMVIGAQDMQVDRDKYRDAFDAESTRVAELERELRWIPVDESLPDDGVEVLATVSAGMPEQLVVLGYRAATSDGEMLISGDGCFRWDWVKAWRPRPEPYNSL